MNIYDMVFHYPVQGIFQMEMEKQDALEGKRSKFLTSSPHILTSRSDTAQSSHEKSTYIPQCPINIENNAFQWRCRRSISHLWIEGGKSFWRPARLARHNLTEKTGRGDI